jgi:prophage regulatory protein
MTDLEHDSIITKEQLRKYVPYSDTHLCRLEAQGKFPRRIPLGPGRVGYSFNEVMAWIKARKAERNIAA